VLRCGAIEVPVHSAYRGPLLEHILTESGARILCCDAEFLERLHGLALPALERVVVRGPLDGPPPGLPCHPLGGALGHDPLAASPKLRGSDVSCLLYTSGTTGRSKGVVLTHTANLQLSRSNIELMEYTSADVLYTAFPLFHVNAKFTSVTSALLTGATLVLDERFSASRFWDRMREEGVTSFNYMGTMLAVLLGQPESSRDRDHRVTRCYGGGCQPTTWAPFERRFGVRLHEHYGMTEIGIATQNTRTVRRPGSIGRAAAVFEVRVADEGDREVPVNQVGEIQVRPRLPDIILREYWRRPEATIEAMRNLWFHTGDRGRMDGDGFFYYVDRLKDSIRRRGENVSSFEVESVVNAYGPVIESAAYGVPSELGEDEVMLAVVVDPQSLDLAGLIAHCQRELPYFAVPRYVRVMTSLPKNPSERVQKFVLREQGVTDDTIDRGPIRRPGPTAPRPSPSARP
jgi:crotonobetaine/carnitine-CoA ligase